ncbi:MAG: methyltransferase domain-containing protein [Burkholderiales bacterium]|nr:methyltransferase domain-containing protein [Burkholderiales bacterium]HQY07284.1 methyltransferase domain-containing protein [Burkholderiaceae bacterium]
MEQAGLFDTMPELVPACAPGDVLGERYCREHSPQARRPHGITLTPDWLVERMLDQVQGSGRFDTIVDPGAGSGRFTLAAARRFPQARIVAVENHPEMLAILRRRVADENLAGRVQVVAQDFREATFETAGRTLYLGNPPYVRHHDLSESWKDWYGRSLSGLGVSGTRLAGLHAHFLVAAAARMRPGDELCFVTSAEWLDNHYGGALRQLFARGGRVALQAVGLWLADAGEPVFADALVSAVVLHLAGGDGSGLCRLGCITGADLQDSRQLAASALLEAPRWSPLCRRDGLEDLGGRQLGEFFHVTRGQVTGSNEVFVLPSDQDLLPQTLTVAAVTRARELIDGAVLSQSGVRGLKRVVNLPRDLERLPEPHRDAAEAFIAQAQRRGAHQGYVARSRRPWYAVDMRAPPAAFVSYMGRRPPVFVANPWGVSYLNIAHGLYPHEPIAPSALERLLQHLNTATSVGSGRMYGGGLAKFEPGDISRLRVPAGWAEGLS